MPDRRTECFARNVPCSICSISPCFSRRVRHACAALRTTTVQPRTRRALAVRRERARSMLRRVRRT
ncbi:hypothetical protein P355_0338 [Burkholderia cenocepacia KC-01]|nr:hypothetical protein P355_0338 [Burkholderia cenocepacia KC-01]